VTIDFLPSFTVLSRPFCSVWFHACGNDAMVDTEELCATCVPGKRYRDSRGNAPEADKLLAQVLAVMSQTRRTGETAQSRFEGCAKPTRRRQCRDLAGSISVRGEMQAVTVVTV